MIQHGRTGLLAGFADVEALAAQAIAVLREPPAYRRLGAAGRALVEERYSRRVPLPRRPQLDFCRRTLRS